MPFTVVLPPDFDDHAWEVEAKGWFDDVFVDFGNGKRQLSFYEPVRLNQDIRDSLDANEPFFTEHIVVVKRITRAGIEEAVKMLYESGRLESNKRLDDMPTSSSD
jgi:hypothetical protein